MIAPPVVYVSILPVAACIRHVRPRIPPVLTDRAVHPLTSRHGHRTILHLHSALHAGVLTYPSDPWHRSRSLPPKRRDRRWLNSNVPITAVPACRTPAPFARASSTAAASRCG